MLCTEKDIDVHFELVRNFIPSKEVIQYKQRMSECITAGSAYTLSDNSCFIYYLNSKPCCAVGMSLYGLHSTRKIFALLTGVFNKIDTHTFKISFRPYPGTSINDFKCVCTPTSMKRYRNGNPLIVRIDKIRKRVHAIYERRGIQWEMT